MKPLPESAYIDLARLRQLADMARAQTEAAHKGILANEEQCRQAAHRARSAGGDQQREAAQRDLETLRFIHAEQVRERAAFDALHRQRAQVVARIEGAVKALPPGRPWLLAAARVAAFTPEAMETERRTIADCDAELSRIAMLPLDSASLKVLVEKRVQELRASCRVAFLGLRGEASFDFKIEGTERGLHKPSGEELLAWLDPAALTARLLAQLPREEGMNLREKQERTHQLQAKKLSAERREEALIRAAAAKGIIVERRVDVDWRAALAVRPSPAREATAA
jgi:hypothetical protein